MHLGFWSTNTPDEERPAVLARALEERGFESFWVGEHTHIPCSRKTPYPAGGDLPSVYLRMMDPVVSLTLAAAASERLCLGTAAALPLEHDVFDLAKSAATLDLASSGRLLFGVGVGWNEEELANCRPLKWSQRYAALSECVAALRALWRDDESEYHGRFYDFDRVWSFPKPARRLGPPVLSAMAGKVGVRHTIGWADEWMPIDVALGDVPRRIARFRQLADEAGRGDIPITIVAWGDPTIDTLLAYRDLGVQRVVLGAARDGWDDPSTTHAFIDRYAPSIDRLA